MRLSRAVVAACALLAACTDGDRPSQPAAPPLDAFIAFSDAKSCVLAPPFAAFMTRLVRTDGTGTRYLAGRVFAPPAYAAQFGDLKFETRSDQTVAVSVPTDGVWQGLRLTSIELHAAPETDMWVTTLVFDASVKQVIAAANRAGFALPKGGRRGIADEELAGFIDVSVRPSGAALSCGT